MRMYMPTQASTLDHGRTDIGPNVNYRLFYPPDVAATPYYGPGLADCFAP